MPFATGSRRHRLLGQTGFFVIGDRRSDDSLSVLSIPTLLTRFKTMWPDAHLFVDACYSLSGIDDPDVDGHADNPLYEDAIDKIVIWAETIILSRSAATLLG